MKHLDDLFHWVGERERIRRQKDSGAQRPWTDDPILHAYRFCNVERERDTVTQWIHHNWLLPNYGDPTVVLGMTIARMVNLPETLEELGFPHEGWTTKYVRRFLDTFDKRRNEGKKSWTSAYMITGGYSEGGEPKEVIIARVIDRCNGKLHENWIRQGDTLAEAADKIKSPGIGDFLSGQIIADLKHSKLLADASDWWEWCAVGPGSTVGLNFIHGREHKKSISQPQFRKEVNEIRNILRDGGVYLDAQNTQNVLCELHKYIRTKYYGGRPKSRYTPAVALPAISPATAPEKSL